MKTLANIKSAIKRAELNVKQNEKNSAQKSAMRTAIKAFEADPSEELFRAASSAIDSTLTQLKKLTVLHQLASIKPLLKV